MKRGRSPSPDTPSKRTHHEPQCFFLTVPRELRDIIRTSLDARERRRLHHTCCTLYMEEPPDVFDFPPSWRWAISRRPSPTANNMWTRTTDGDMARTLWSLGWHRWPGMEARVMADRETWGELTLNFSWMSFTLRLTIGYDRFVDLSWTPWNGEEASGTVPWPDESDGRAPTIMLFRTYGSEALQMVKNYFKSLAAAALPLMDMT